jgi:regulator of sigma D
MNMNPTLSQFTRTWMAKDEEIRAAYQQIAKLEAALNECVEYFDDRADADCDQDGYIPNDAMKMLCNINEALHGPGGF